MKREWTDIKAVESLIIKMREKGKKRQEIADIPGLKKVQICEPGYSSGIFTFRPHFI